MIGTVMCGYQGWFTTPQDGSGRGWHHWDRRGQFRPGMCSIDFWPDVSELDADERFVKEIHSPAGLYHFNTVLAGGAGAEVDPR